MDTSLLFDLMNTRVDNDREDGDIAYLNALLLQLEYVTKLVTAGIVACITDSPDRHRYSLEHKLVRASSIGEWVQVLDQAVKGPSAEYLRPEARNAAQDLTERVGEGAWQHIAVQLLSQAAQDFELDKRIGAKVALLQLFGTGVELRNATRGHGAPTSGRCSKGCPRIAEAVRLLTTRFALFTRPWAHLHRNLSGKYRVSPLLGDCSAFDYLKKTRDTALPEGVCLWLDGPVPVPLVSSDTEVRNVFLPNGSYDKNSRFELLSYVTGDVTRVDGSGWHKPPGPLPRSETEGHMALDQYGNTFANVPPTPVGHIPRRELEHRVLNELRNTDIHPIITLAGPGGIGKTTVAIAVIEALSRDSDPPYGVILWMSARDVDLLESGPKPVTPRVLGQKDIAEMAAGLLEPPDRQSPRFDPLGYFQRALATGAAGTTLYVFDNFETLGCPEDVFTWLDTHVRPPNKVLITTRYRRFLGDYPIEIGGMTEEESRTLIDQQAERLGVHALLNSGYIDKLYKESDGHPYVIKILLGQVARERRAVEPERIMANADRLLEALFERTFTALSPAGQRVFLLLCSWRVMVPAIAVEVVLLRPGKERFDVSDALDELRRYSLVEETVSQTDGEAFVGVPLAAAAYGRRKLEVSRFRSEVEEDKKLLMEFGAGKREDVHRGVLPRIDRLVRAVAGRASEDLGHLGDFEAILEYLASRVPKVYLRLAELVREVGDGPEAAAKAKNYLRRYLETAEVHERSDVWQKLAGLCHETGDLEGEISALCEIALLPTTTPELLGALANQLNNRLRDAKTREAGDQIMCDLSGLLGQVAQVMERHLDTMSATDCSRLAWLYLNIRKEDRAREIADLGRSREPENEHCQNLITKLGAP